MTELTFFKNRDNSVLLKLFQSGVELSYGTITKAELKYATGSVDSILNPTQVSISSGVRLRLGSLSFTTPIKFKSKLIIYTASWPNGVVWIPELMIRLIEG